MNPEATMKDSGSSSKSSGISDPEDLLESNSSSKSDQEDDNSSTGQSLTFPVADAIAHESLRRSESSPTMSPPVQVMDRSSGYDPMRIPLSVFEPSSTTLDWSCASNDSLFSIHVGNNSFSRDQQNLFNELKSEELAKLEESHILSPTEPFPEVDRDEELKVPVAETANQSIETQNYQGAAAAGVAVDNKTHETATQIAVQDHTHQKRESPHPSLSSKSSSRSNKSGSADSAKSFAFPILSGGLKNGSDKVDIEEQHLQAPSSAGTSKSDFRHWFRCFSCPSWSCPSCRCRFRRRCRCCCSCSCYSCFRCCC
ncbi:hypothetical protein Tsubulata_020537 [Turnera subulata]|uniref:Uncharacterized protein n=1 Tax=Turnera subulata TaxID=218843 RepID=A0A9Q0FXJ0_9ROSI|nr:hypothetical protein Tsubulata_020537 [Turnera subulata]